MRVLDHYLQRKEGRDLRESMTFFFFLPQEVSKWEEEKRVDGQITHEGKREGVYLQGLNLVRSPALPDYQLAHSSAIEAQAD